MFQTSVPAICTALVLASFAPAQAATITDDAAEVVLYAGDILAESYAPTSDIPDFNPVYALLSGGVSGFDPAFVFSLDDDTGEALYGESNTYVFDGTDTLQFTFDVTGSAAALFGDVILVEFLFAGAISDPFGAATDIFTTAAMRISPVAVAAVPLPAGLPLLASALAGAAFLRRRRSR
ncbi:VPLPA-CTERM sorting domain-containing protein [Pseudoruegeria sp. SK021]|uniref:VPLPA-CTERM sorting domain-containing protein n=1 Tax=Pseudoruegeria sp. SK021 TaxID=1933035 RepID=UPI000A264B84|nr:VPLPA-CTERM sorting domain-containing protein [Pseudoruegeria sp. SK021]OSP54233.1 hypothetical protein BV911_13865 [Pseudoruegeria sp. SK021]